MGVYAANARPDIGLGMALIAGRYPEARIGCGDNAVSLAGSIVSSHY